MTLTTRLGDRPLPSKLGGGDLDGDEYNLLPLNDLPQFRPDATCPPGEYSPAPRKLLESNATMSDVADFVVDYIKSDVSLPPFVILSFLTVC